MNTENRASNRKGPPKAHQFKPGQSGNPGGRPKGLAAKAREATNDGQLLIQFWLDVVAGKIKGATGSDKMRASALLAERGWGRPEEYVEVTGAGGGAIEHAHHQVKEPARLANILGHLATMGIERIGNRKVPINGENGENGNGH